MSQPPPRKLDYRAPHPRRRHPDDQRHYGVFKFLGGLAGGIALSAVTWRLAEGSSRDVFVVAWAWLPFLKAYFAGCFLIYRPLKLVGTGILVSIAIEFPSFALNCGYLV